MINLLSLTASFLLQMTGAYLAVRLARKTGKSRPWMILAVALVLMALTQTVALSEILLGGGEAPGNLTVSIVTTVVAILMLGVVRSLESTILEVADAGRKTWAASVREASYLDSARGLVLALDSTGTVILVNRAGSALLGYRKNEILGRNWFTDFLPQQQEAHVYELFRQCIAGEQKCRDFIDNEIVARDGSRIPVRWKNSLVRDSGGLITGMLATGTDMSKQRELAGQLAASEERFSHVVNSAATGIIVISETGTVTQLNPFTEKMFGYKASEVIGRNVSMLMAGPDRSRHDKHLGSYLRTGKTKIIGVGREVSGRRKNGELFSLHLSVSEVAGSGQKNFVGIISDITERKLAEERLRHSQKMETVGQLTGGVAHDFNNLLAVILGNLCLLEEELHDKDDLSIDGILEFVEQAIAAGQRGADLTRRLLAFSRKQALQPVVLDINTVVRDMEQLLARTVGAGIDLTWRLGVSTWIAEVDRSQLDNVLLNLAVNARDAMPQGGTLTVETGEVTLGSDHAGSHGDVLPGDYLMVAVTDTGCGMEASVVERVFEPFFTTKEVGKGTGLGLSMVYGFVKQSGGHVSVYSEPGAGTSVKLYLPRAQGTAVTDKAVEQQDRACRSLAGDETILVVEDDAAVRRIAVQILERLGYRVRQAEDGQLALGILDEGGAIDLLLTDVVLPGGMDGPAVVKIAQQKIPDLKVLYMSGYTENVILHQGRFGERVNLIGKPFSNTDLAEKVRDVLGAN